MLIAIRNLSTTARIIFLFPSAPLSNLYLSHVISGNEAAHIESESCIGFTLVEIIENV